MKGQLEIAGYAAIGLGVLEILIVLFTTYLIFRGADAGKIRRAFTGNFAVAVAEPVAYRQGEEIRQSVPVNNEEFEVDMSTIGSRSTTERRSKLNLGSATRVYMFQPGKAIQRCVHMLPYFWSYYQLRAALVLFEQTANCKTLLLIRYVAIGVDRRSQRLPAPGGASEKFEF